MLLPCSISLTLTLSEVEELLRGYGTERQGQILPLCLATFLLSPSQLLCILQADPSIETYRISLTNWTVFTFDTAPHTSLDMIMALLWAMVVGIFVRWASGLFCQYDFLMGYWLFAAVMYHKSDIQKTVAVESRSLEFSPQSSVLSK